MNFFHFNLQKLIAERVRYLSPESLWPPGHPGLEVSAQLTPDVGLEAFKAVVENTQVTISAEHGEACDGVPLRRIPSRGGLLQGRPETLPYIARWTQSPENQRVLVLVSYHGPVVDVPEKAELHIIMTPTPEVPS